MNSNKSENNSAPTPQDRLIRTLSQSIYLTEQNIKGQTEQLYRLKALLISLQTQSQPQSQPQPQPQPPSSKLLPHDSHRLQPYPLKSPLSQQRHIVSNIDQFGKPISLQHYTNASCIPQQKLLSAAEYLLFQQSTSGIVQEQFSSLKQSQNNTHNLQSLPPQQLQQITKPIKQQQLVDLASYNTQSQLSQQLLNPPPTYVINQFDFTDSTHNLSSSEQSPVPPAQVTEQFCHLVPDQIPLLDN